MKTKILADVQICISVSLNQDLQLIIHVMIDQQFFYKHVFEQSEWFVFCHVFRLPVTYKIGMKYFDVIFLQNSSKKLSCFRRKLCCNGAIFLVAIFFYQSIFPKKLQR